MLNNSKQNVTLIKLFVVPFNLEKSYHLQHYTYVNYPKSKERFAIILIILKRVRSLRVQYFLLNYSRNKCIKNNIKENSY